jgi:hypothetical protein
MRSRRLFRAKLAVCGLVGGFLYNLSRLHLFPGPTYSTGVHDKLTCGYGRVDHNGFWQFPVRSKEE